MKQPSIPKDFGLTACALCGEPRALRASHIIPRFVFAWLLETSATGHMRLGTQPNRRAQDGWKPKLLCHDCEQRFCTWEKAFSEKVFVPLHDGTIDRFAYESWLLKYAVSISWRVLTVFKLIGGLDDFPLEARRAADRALKWWSEFLLDQRADPGPYEQHMMPVDLLVDAEGLGFPPNINRYLYRAVDIWVAHAGPDVVTYAKTGRVLLFGFIRMSYPRRWRGTKLNLQRGILGADRYELPANIRTFFIGRAERLHARYQEISPRQRELITRAVEADPDRVAASEVFRAMQQDVSMFGRDAFEPGEDEGVSDDDA
jgi:hypothetical protein